MKASLKSKTIGCILLVTGTQIGAGMLALPITTGVAGFIPAIVLFSCAFVYMLMNLFVLLEANLSCPQQEANIISIAKQQLGRTGQGIAWLSFLLLLYAASAAYLVGGSSLIVSELKPFVSLSHTYSTWLFAACFGLIAYFGIVWIDRLNRLLMLGLIISYLLSIMIVAPEVKFAHLTTQHFPYLWAAVPVVILSFTSHIVIPSVTYYLERNIPLIKRTIWIGSSIPFLCYVIWEFTLVGTVPAYGPNGLHAIAASSTPLATLTQVLTHMHLPFVANTNLFFSIFAISTSFLGVILSLCDFLADGFNIQKTHQGRALLMLMSFAPPLIFALLFPSSFILALGYAGVFVAILYGILPSLIVWKTRYHAQTQSSAPYRFPAGRYTLVALMIIAVIVIGLQIAASEHWLPTP